MTATPYIETPLAEYRIVNIHHGTGARSNIIYAEIRDDNDNLIVCATLDYIVDWLKRQNRAK